ncbi:MAG: ABC transporter ATP-binding protein [Dehalococcoidia bacterium]
MTLVSAVAATAPASTTLLRARDLDVTVGGTDVLHGVSVEVHAGEVVGLIGPNGAGKSTLLRALTGLAPLNSGSVEVAGQALRTSDRRTLARTVAVVQQMPEAPPSITVAELALLGRSPYLGLLARESARDHAIAMQAMERAGCAALAARTLGTLSGGQRRRAFIARALAQETPLLLLDEPTANLDVQAQCEIFELVRRLAADGVGVLVVVHDLTLAATYCDRLLLLDAGRVVAEGAPHEVVTAEHVQRVYGTRVTVINDSGHRAPIVVPVAVDKSEARR